MFEEDYNFLSIVKRCVWKMETEEHIFRRMEDELYDEKEILKNMIRYIQKKLRKEQDNESGKFNKPRLKKKLSEKKEELKRLNKPVPVNDTADGPKQSFANISGYSINCHECMNMVAEKIIFLMQKFVHSWQFYLKSLYQSA